MTVHGVVYGLRDGILRDIGIGASSAAELERRYAAVVQP